MNKWKVIALSIIFVLGLLALSMAMNSEGDNKVLENNTAESPSKTLSTHYGGVTEISSNEFENKVLKSDKKVLVDFYADWCGPCQMLSPLVEEVAKENSKVSFFKVNVDDNSELSDEYGVMYIPTLIVFEKGKEKARSTGYVGKAKIEELIK